MGMKPLILQITAITIGGLLCALLVAQCREIKQTRDAVIKMEAKQK
jgi:hypothetical protein